LTEFRAVIVLTGVLTIPGWAALSLSNLWPRWSVLQRWIVAVGLSIAFYPVLLYALRFLVPSLTLGPYKMGTLLLGLAVVIAWRMHGHWREQFALERLEWIAVAVFGMTLFTRFWIIHHHPYPAWSDSLHHAILTRLTAGQGQLPETMESYFPVPLGQYHLGLYSLSATVQWLSQAPAHTALLWTAQALNGLCGLGVYLALDRKVGRVGAVVGAVTVGLMSHQPAFYVNWGRFTQLSGQTILLIAWLVTWDAVGAWRLPWREQGAGVLWQTGLAALLTGGLFLLHFRVAGFYLPLLGVSVLWELWKGRKEKRLSAVALGVGVIGLASLLVAAPAMARALSGYISSSLSATASGQAALPTNEVAETVERYYEFPLSTVPYLAAHTWLLVLSGFSIIGGLIRRNRLVIAALIWGGSLLLLGNAHVLSVPVLRFTNLGAVLIMLYLPIGLVVGAAAEEVVRLGRRRWRGTANAAVALALMGGFVTSHARAEDFEPHRFFVTSQDLSAMEWIKKNTPDDALFAVNTYFWLPRAPHGTDAGYWIPYFTGRQTTAGTMLLSLAEQAYVDSIVEMSRAAERLEVDNAALVELQMMGVDYLYIGRNGDFSGPGLDASQLGQARNTRELYRNGGVSILRIGAAD
jgi:hypothetical protein